VYSDAKYNIDGKFDCAQVPNALSAFPAHSSPLGLEYFDGSFLVALHGSTNRRLRRGYKVVRVSESGSMQDFITGFFDAGKINGRPADIFSYGRNAFLLTDDYSGVIYYVYRNS
jgi:glucose/arabinose dehydrogenase